MGVGAVVRKESGSGGGRRPVGGGGGSRRGGEKGEPQRRRRRSASRLVGLLVGRSVVLPAGGATRQCGYPRRRHSTLTPTRVRGDCRARADGRSALRPSAGRRHGKARDEGAGRTKPSLFSATTAPRLRVGRERGGRGAESGQSNRRRGESIPEQEYGELRQGSAPGRQQGGPICWPQPVPCHRRHGAMAANCIMHTCTGLPINAFRS